MKKIISVFLSMVLMLSLTACADVHSDNENGLNGSRNGAESSYNGKTDGQNGEDANGLNGNPSDSDILIAYFSCTGNTAQMADYIASQTGGVLFDITPVTPYVSNDLDYKNEKCRAKKEYNHPDARPEISIKIKNFEQYKTIYLGYPIWYGDAPKIIYTFLESYDFSGKTIIPFCTSEETDIKNSVKNIKKLAPKAEWKKGKRFSPSALQKDIDKWLS